MLERAHVRCFFKPRSWKTGLAFSRLAAHRNLSKSFQSESSNFERRMSTSWVTPVSADTSEVGGQVLGESSWAESLFQFGFNRRNKSFRCTKNPYGYCCADRCRLCNANRRVRRKMRWPAETSLHRATAVLPHIETVN